MSRHLDYAKAKRLRAASAPRVESAAAAISDDELRSRIRTLARKLDVDIPSPWSMTYDEKLSVLGYLMDVEKGIR